MSSSFAINVGSLAALASNAAVIAEFPMFAPRPTAAPRIGATCCASPHGVGNAPANETVVRAVLHLGGPKIARLKQLLGVGKLVVTIASPQGPTTHTL